MKKAKVVQFNPSMHVRSLFEQAWTAQLNADLYMHRVRELTDRAWAAFRAENPSLDKDANLTYSNCVVTQENK